MYAISLDEQWKVFSSSSSSLSLIMTRMQCDVIRIIYMEIEPELKLIFIVIFFSLSSGEFFSNGCKILAQSLI
jgi:hypothetical protein